ncbi:MAG: hypothetical protein FWG50_10715 [Kiritimatiellaeota bacterium]|nr:hypothetical protein [Kiritimatiellota bacterium]
MEHGLIRKIMLIITAITMLLLLFVMNTEKRSTLDGNIKDECVNVENVRVENADVESTNPERVHAESTNAENMGTGDEEQPTLAALMAKSIASATEMGITSDSPEVAEYVKIARAKVWPDGKISDDTFVPTTVIVQGENILVVFGRYPPPKKGESSSSKILRRPMSQGEISIPRTLLLEAEINVIIDIKAKTVVRIDRSQG